jgi:hypothetical protein
MGIAFIFYQIILMYWRHRLQGLLLIMYKELLSLPAMLDWSG